MGSQDFSAVALTDGDRQAWTDLLIGSINGSHRQSFQVQDYRRLFGWRSEGFLFKEGEQTVAGAFYAVKPFPFRLGSLGEVPGGFVFRRQPDAELLKRLLEHLLDWAGRRRVSILRLDTWLPASIAGKPTEYGSWLPGALGEAGFLQQPGASGTYWIDLTQDEEQLLGRMDKQTRYNIRKAEREGVQVEVHRDTAILETFFDLYHRRGEQKALEFVDQEFVFAQAGPLIQAGLALVFAASHGGKIRNMTFASCFGLARSILSALDPDVLKDKSVPPTGQKLRWEVIRALKAMGCKIHDMGGAEGPVPVEGHPAYGIWRFKWSFGGDYVEFFPTCQKTLRPLSAGLARWAARLKGKQI